MKSLFYKLSKIWFHLFQAKRFKKISFKTYLAPSVKFQGHEFMEIQNNVSIHKHSWLGCYKVPQLPDPLLVLSEGVVIGNFCHISCTGSMIIEKNVLIADRITIADSVHNFSDISTPIIKQGYGFLRNVTIGEGSWIGDNACILGVKIGKNCVIGAGSVVTKDVPDYCIVVGNPARVVKRYDTTTREWVKV